MAADSRREIDLLGLTLAQGHTVAVDMTEDGASGEQSITIIAHY